MIFFVDYYATRIESWVPATKEPRRKETRSNELSAFAPSWQLPPSFSLPWAFPSIDLQVKQ